jgi:hypothetical protein
LEEIGSLVELVSRISVPFFQCFVQHLVSKGCRVIVFDVKNLVVELWQFEIVVLSDAKRLWRGLFRWPKNDRIGLLISHDCFFHKNKFSFHAAGAVLKLIGFFHSLCHHVWIL